MDIKLQLEAASIAKREALLQAATGRLPAAVLWNDDCISEAVLAALEALPRWKPAQGALPAFLRPRIRGAILAYLRRERLRGMRPERSDLAPPAVVGLGDPAGSEESFTTTAPGIVGGYELTYEDVTAYPDPAPAGMRATDTEAAAMEHADAIQRLPEPYRQALLLYSGLDGGAADSTGGTLRGIAARIGARHPQEVTRILATGITLLREELRKPRMRPTDGVTNAF